MIVHRKQLQISPHLKCLRVLGISDTCLSCLSRLPLPPGSFSTLYKNDAKFTELYFTKYPVSEFLVTAIWTGKWFEHVGEGFNTSP